MSVDWYDRDGILVTDMERNELLLGDPNYKRVAYTEIRDAHNPDGGYYRVSTVWLGLNHNYGDGPPLIFETMVFEGADYRDLNMDRYATEIQARIGHEVLVKETAKRFKVALVINEVKESDG